MRQKTKQGFTLLEMMVVVAILGILIIVLFSMQKTANQGLKQTILASDIDNRLQSCINQVSTLLINSADGKTTLTKTGTPPNERLDRITLFCSGSGKTWGAYDKIQNFHSGWHEELFLDGDGVLWREIYDGSMALQFRRTVARDLTGWDATKQNGTVTIRFSANTKNADNTDRTRSTTIAFRQKDN